MTRLLLIRHGETEWNVQRRYQGQADVPLNKAGQRQAAALARQLKAEQVAGIHASNLQRAQQTALAITAQHSLSVREDPRLREIALGDWEGLTYDQIRERWPEEMAAWFADPLQVAPPGGETLAHVARRVEGALDDITRANTDQTVVLVSHGGPLRVLLCLALGLDVRAHWQFQLDVASISELHVHGEHTTLVRLNDTHHLDTT